MTSGWNVSHANHCTDGCSSQTSAGTSAAHGLVEPIAREQVDRHGPEREHDDLQQVDELRSRTEPVEGDEEEVPERRVMPEDREPAHGREPMAA